MAVAVFALRQHTIHAPTEGQTEHADSPFTQAQENAVAAGNPSPGLDSREPPQTTSSLALDPPALFSDLEITPALEESTQDLLEEFPAIRYRIVEVESNIIRQAISDANTDPGTMLVLPLFEGVSLESTVFQAVNYTSGPRVGMSTWLGTLLGFQGSLAVHVDVDDSVRVNAYSDGRWFQILAVANQPGAHLIVETDRDALANVNER